MRIELIAFKWLERKISPSMILSLAGASAIGVTNFVRHATDGATTIDYLTTAATNLCNLATDSRQFVVTVMEKRNEIGLDENGRTFINPGRARNEQNLAAARKVGLMAGMVYTLLETYYASTDLYPISGGRYGPDGNRKTLLSQIRPCQVCAEDVCSDYDHNWTAPTACFCGHNANLHWEGTEEGNRNRLIWELSNKLYPLLKRVDATGKLKESWYENAKCCDCGCADFGLVGDPDEDALCDCGHEATRHFGGQPGDWVVYGVSELLSLALDE